MDGTRVLIIEDDTSIARFLELELTHEGFSVTRASDGRSGVATFISDGADLVVLDIMLPELSGIEVCRRIRQRSRVPVIMLTAKGDVADKVHGLDTGADDYITKPFEIEELLARMRAAFRRNGSAPEAPKIRQVQDLSISPAERRVWRDGREIELTRREFDLLEYLVRNRGVVLSRTALLEHVWGWANEVETNTVDVYVRYLRRKIDRPDRPSLITTVRGVGYTIRESHG